jgi:enoyl-CoA hydratase/carnithine racemase
VQLELENGIATITLNRPEKKNALTVEMYERIVQGLLDYDADPNARVIMIRSEGDAFTSGNDLKDFMNAPPAGEDSPVFRLLMTLVDLEKPLVAEVNGLAVGIGTTLLFHCDLVYAAKNARFQMPFVNLGLCPEAASSFLLPRFLGMPKASELLMLGEAFSAHDALDMGIVNALFPDEDLRAEARSRAEKLAAQPAAAVRATKKLLREDLRAATKASIEKEGALFIERLASPEAREAFTAFFEKRKPDFTQFS